MQETLPDLLAPGLRLLSIGLNPSLPSVAAGFYFAHPRNRFWRALNGSTLLREPVRPGRSAMKQLLQREGIGFTDVVKRPTRGARDLRNTDFQEGATLLLAHLQRYQPTIAWFHGKVAYRNFARHAGLETGICDWGEQRARLDATRIYVTPNPSPANAAWSLDSLVSWYNELARYSGRLY
jgi:TDG/mug DNA glycosylase family protein